MAAVASTPHASILLFSLCLGGLVALLTRSGGAQGLAVRVVAVASTPQRAQLATWLLGALIFFDDYANALLVGNAMRPITDRLRISREKLAFLVLAPPRCTNPLRLPVASQRLLLLTASPPPPSQVDATSAPVASLAPISSWIGFELGLLQQGYASLGLATSPYAAFLATLPMRFYPINMLLFGLSSILLGRDFGPMLAAERRARRHGLLTRPPAPGATAAAAADGADDSSLRPKEGAPPRMRNALIPIGAVVLTVAAGLLIDGATKVRQGEAATLVRLFSLADSFHALLWASAVGLLVPMLLYKAQGLMSAAETFQVWVGGMAPLLEPLMVLVLAWALGTAVEATRLSSYVIAALDGVLPAPYLPTATFVLSALVATATGSSWGTMAVMVPLVCRLAWEIGGGDEAVLTAALSSILAGAVFGDHSAPTAPRRHPFLRLSLRRSPAAVLSRVRVFRRAMACARSLSHLGHDAALRPRHPLPGARPRAHAGALCALLRAALGAPRHAAALGPRSARRRLPPPLVRRHGGLPPAAGAAERRQQQGGRRRRRRRYPALWAVPVHHSVHSAVRSSTRSNTGHFMIISSPRICHRPQLFIANRERSLQIGERGARALFTRHAASAHAFTKSVKIAT